MIALLGRFHLDVFHVELTEQVPCQVSPSSRIIGPGLAVSGKYPSGPELRAEYDNGDDDHQQGYQHHITPDSPLQSSLTLTQGPWNRGTIEAFSLCRAPSRWEVTGRLVVMGRWFRMTGVDGVDLDAHAKDAL
jgi:hypothetical protein